MPVQGWVQLSSRHHSWHQAQGPSSSTAGTSRSRSEASSCVSTTKRPRLLRSARCWAAHDPCSLQTPAQAVLWGVQEKKCHISSRDSAHSPPLSHYIEMCSLRLHYKPRSFTCYIFSSFSKKFRISLKYDWGN